MRSRNSLNAQAGFGLTETIVALGILGILLFGVMKASSSFFASQKKINKLGSDIDLRRWVYNVVDCTESMKSAATACTQSESAIGLVGLGGGSVVGAQGGSISKNYSIRAKCGTSIGDNEILIEYQHAATPGVWKSVFGDIPYSCDVAQPVSPARPVEGYNQGVGLVQLGTGTSQFRYWEGGTPVDLDFSATITNGVTE